jgi:hypothetical protein
MHADAGESARAAVCASLCVRQFGMGLAGCKEFLSAACTKCELCDEPITSSVPVFRDDPFNDATGLYYEHTSGTGAVQGPPDLI